MSAPAAPMKSGNREVEYTQTIAYIQHMYDTRHQIFQFVVALDTGLMAVVFQFLQSDKSRMALSILGGFVTLATLLMARRSWTYLNVLESYAMELESTLGYGLVRCTSARMPKGTDSTVYLFLIYWALVLMWVILSVVYVLRSFGVFFRI